MGLQWSDFQHPIIYACWAISGGSILIMFIVFIHDWSTSKGLFRNRTKKIVGTSDKSGKSSNNGEVSEQSEEETEVETDTSEEKQTFQKKYRDRKRDIRVSLQQKQNIFKDTKIKMAPATQKKQNNLKSTGRQNGTNASFRNKNNKSGGFKDRKKTNDSHTQKKQDENYRSGVELDHSMCNEGHEIIVSTAIVPKVLSLSSKSSQVYHPAQLEERAYRISRWITDSNSKSNIVANLWAPHYITDSDTKLNRETNFTVANENLRNPKWIESVDKHITERNKSYPPRMKDTDTKRYNNANVRNFIGEDHSRHMNVISSVEKEKDLWKKQSPYCVEDTEMYSKNANMRYPHWIKDSDSKHITDENKHGLYWIKDTDNVPSMRIEDNIKFDEIANLRAPHWIKADISDTNKLIPRSNEADISNRIKDKSDIDLNKQNLSISSNSYETLMARLDDVIHCIAVFKTSATQENMNQLEEILVVKNTVNNENCCHDEGMKNVTIESSQSSGEAVDVQYLEKICKSVNPGDLVSPESVKMKKKVETYLKGFHEYRNIDEGVFRKTSHLMDDLVQYWKNRENSKSSSDPKTNVVDS